MWITASHEVRKPITVAYGVLQTLQRPAPEVDRGLREGLVAVAVQQVQMIADLDEITSPGEDIPHTSYADHMKYAV